MQRTQTMPVPELVAASPVCPVCSGAELRRFQANAFDSRTPARVHIVECQSCYFAWQHPQVRSAEDSVTYFSATYADEGRTDTGYFAPDYKNAVSNLELDFVESLPNTGRRLLDVGAGAGIFASVAAQRGWQATALDPALDPARVADSRVRAITGVLADVPANEQFDVVTLWDVVEHAIEPVALIEGARDLLRPGGWVVVETGNYKSVDRISGGVDCWIFQLDHRWYFAPESMAGLLERAGFTDMTFAQRVLRPNWQGTTGYAGPSLVHLLKSLVRRPAQIAHHFARHRALQQARHWQQPGLGIFCVAGRRA
ncbi:MAG: class I SAM-dependent methyltransferase [Gammaproteobacteria bacterium]|nr:class I SAM-dependent methyltransferase [Gammaproteobacteria bacterium]